MKNQKIVNIRAMAIFIVVLGHSIILYSDSWSLFETIHKVPVLNLVKDLINIIQMPLFFSLSGFLFFYSAQKKYNIVDFIKSKFFRLVIPYLFIAFLYMVPIRTIINFSGYEKMTMSSIIKYTLLGINNGHLWYLYALFVIFIFMYFVDKGLKQINNDWLDIIVFMIMALLSFNTYNLKVQCLNDAIRYSVWFYMGYLINKYHSKFNVIRIKVSTMVLAILFVILCLFIEDDLLELLARIFSILFLYQSFTDKSNKFINSISENSFGVYLFHSPLVYITYTYIPNANPIFIVLLNFVVFGLLAFILSYFIKKTRLKFIIGEGYVDKKN